MAGSRSDRQGRRAAPPPVIDLKAEEVVETAHEPAADDPDQASPEGEMRHESPVEETLSRPETSTADEVPVEPDAEPAHAAGPPPDRDAQDTMQESSRWRGMAAYAAAAAALIVLGGVLAYAFGDRIWSRGPDPDVLALTARLDQTAAGLGALSDRVTAVERDLTGLRDAHGKLAADVDNLRKAFDEQTAAARNSIDSNDSRIAEVDRRATEIQGAIDALRSSVAAAGDSGANALVTGELKTSFDALSTRLAETEKRLAATTAELEAVRQTQNRATENQGRVDNTSAALGQAATALAGKIRQGQPFAGELDALATLAPATPGLDVLRLHAGTGAPSAAALAAKLSELLPTLPGAKDAEAEPTAPATGLWARFTASVSSLVKVRRLDEVDWPATVARARGALETGDIDAAIGILEAASATPPQPIADWLKQ
ncbi:MAG: hypothetical protein AB7E66_12520, partial [Parvibaculaceae bacterium]